jgi:hypothetical protein
VQRPDEVVRHPGEEGRETAPIGRAEEELADADVPAEVGGRGDIRQFAERPDKCVVEPVFQGRIQPGARVLDRGHVDEHP